MNCIPGYVAFVYAAFGIVIAFVVGILCGAFMRKEPT